VICLIAGNYQEALTYAKGQLFDHDEWFFPRDPIDLEQRSNFHVLVIGTAGLNVPPAYFERIFQLAKTRGRIGRT
jgi:hypothetical protein